MSRPIDLSDEDENNLFLDDPSGELVEIAVPSEFLDSPNSEFTDKCGGRPDWPSSIDSSLHLICPPCSDSLRLAVQLFPPDDSLRKFLPAPPNLLIDRIICVFTCHRLQCQNDSAVWRAISHTRVTEEISEPIESKEENEITDEFGAASDWNFASVDEEIERLIAERNETKNISIRKSPTDPSKSTKLIEKSSEEYFRSFALAFSEEPPAASLDSQLAAIRAAHSAAIENLSNENENSSESDEGGGVEDYEISDRMVDPNFSSFCARLKRQPDQILRYRFGGDPILPDRTEIIESKCTGCGLARVPEFQLTPAIFDSSTGIFSGSIDWITAIVRVCPDPINCEQKLKVEEILLFRDQSN